MMNEDRELDNWELNKIEYVWLCVCGTLVNSEGHCPNCHAQPIWGCQCEECQEMENYWQDEELFWLDEEFDF